jgi:putative DNA primase/helicase
MSEARAGRKHSADCAEYGTVAAMKYPINMEYWLPKNKPADKEDWPDPLPIGSELPPVEAFDSLLLPESLRAFVEDIAERMQVPLDYPAACLMTAMAGAVSRRARIQPKAEDSSWSVTPNLWGGIIGLSGFLKSPTLHMMTAPLYEQEAIWRAEYAGELENYEIQKEEFGLRLDAWKQQAKASFKGKGSQPLRPDTSITPPIPKRLITCDSTFEKLHVLMQENPAGLLVIRDELTGWLAELDREGRQGERGFFLSAWNGDTPFTIDRVGRGSIHVPACCVSMLGGITPGRLRSYLVDALQDGPSNDGLIQRFQLLVWPDPPRTWRYIDRTPAKHHVIREMFERILKLDLDLIAHFRFNPEAQEYFIDWLGDLERKIRSEELHPAVVSHLAKYRKLMPSLGLLLSTADQLTTEGCLHDPPRVFLEQAQQAARWCGYLQSHAQRVYACVVTATMQAAADLAAKLKAKAVCGDGTFAVRDVYRHHWSHLDTPERVLAALDVLEDAGWVRRVQSDSIPGRPPNLYTLNPRIYR